MSSEMNTNAIVRHWLIENGQDSLPHVMEVLDAASRDEVSELAMTHSLCPIHFIDWAICFDDQTVDCEQIRLIFPIGHDT